MSNCIYIYIYVYYETWTRLVVKLVYLEYLKPLTLIVNSYVEIYMLYFLIHKSYKKLIISNRELVCIRSLHDESNKFIPVNIWQDLIEDSMLLRNNLKSFIWGYTSQLGTIIKATMQTYCSKRKYMIKGNYIVGFSLGRQHALK